MPRQNRITPLGELVASPARGLWMGNRGCLHDDQGQITGRRWTTRAWVTCLLSFKNRQRQLMQPRRYTELFFLDEPTAFAAGHRPCGECRREDHVRFRDGWLAANAQAAARISLGLPPGLKQLDEVLHVERVVRMDGKQQWRVKLDDLPDGAMILPSPEIQVPAKQPLLVVGAWLFPWQPSGYSPPIPRPQRLTVPLITPPSVVATFLQGYQPQWHPSANIG